MDRFLAASAAPVFVFLWSTGFIGAKYGLPYAEPMTFLSVRFALVIAVLLIWVMALGSPWPTRREIPHLMVVGALLHGGYLGGVYVAISLGVEAGASALIVSLQPVLVAAFAGVLLGERVRPAQWAGIGIAFAGVALVVEQKLAAGIGTLGGMMLCLLSLIAISAATLYQKRFCPDTPLATGAAVQTMGASLVVMPLSLLFEDRVIDWSSDFLLALFWLVFMLSIGALCILFALIQRGAASEVASLFFLVPPSTALIAWALFGETLGPLALLGMALAVIGVAIVMRSGKGRTP